MIYSKTNWGRLVKTPSAVSRPGKGLLDHPFTYIVLVWLFLWLAFYVATTFI